MGTEAVENVVEDVAIVWVCVSSANSLLSGFQFCLRMIENSNKDTRVWCGVTKVTKGYKRLQKVRRPK
jgi:hypothetical protein